MSNVYSSLFYEYILEIDEQEEADEIGEVSNSALTFSAELFSRRFENGYDLPDPKYIRWLRIHYPIAANVLSETSTGGLLEGPSVTPVSICSPAQLLRILLHIIQWHSPLLTQH